MIVIKVELHTVYGNKTLGIAKLGNMSNLADLSNYQGIAVEARNPLINAGPKKWRFEIREHVRRQSIWALVWKAAERICLTSSEWAGDEKELENDGL